MVDKSGLKIVGWLFGSATAAVMLIAALLVSEAVASHPGAMIETTLGAMR